MTSEILIGPWGNYLLGDDSLGNMVATHVRQFAPANVEVLSTPETGFHLLDYALNVRRLIVVDTVVTGSAPPGTIYEFRDTDLKSPPGGSPHYVGLFEALAVAGHLCLPVPEEVELAEFFLMIPMWSQLALLMLSSMSVLRFLHREAAYP